MPRVRSLAALIGLLLVGCQAPAPSGPSPEPGSSPSAQPSSAPSSAPQATAVLRGAVYDEKANFAPDGTDVEATSLDPARPFTAKVAVAGGNYTIGSVPVDLPLRLTASRPGWTSRERIIIPLANEKGLENLNRFNFGGPESTADPAGASHFISDYPEIASIEPLHGATSQPHERLTFKLVMSEPLDPTNQRRLASSFVIIPNSPEALSNTQSLAAEVPTVLPSDAPSYQRNQLTGLFAGLLPLQDTPYRFRQGTGFLQDSVIADFKWEADGKTATFDFPVPIKTASQKEAQYAFLLVQNGPEALQDPSGKPLGVSASGSFGPSSDGAVVLGALRIPEVALVTTTNTNAELRWRETHRSYATFSVARDEKAPGLKSIFGRSGVSSSTENTPDRLEIAFDEPMMVAPALAATEVLSLNNYAIATYKTEAEARDAKFPTLNQVSFLSAGTDAAGLRSALAAGPVAIDSNGSQAGTDFKLAFKPGDAATVILSLPGGSWPVDAAFVRVFLIQDGSGGVLADPAGNPVPSGTTISGLLQ